jgi:beta-phosphoglucomutase-like phosphatase (HAD superfamily)
VNEKASATGRTRSRQGGGDAPQSPPVDAVLFDLDGTLVDTEVIWVAVTEEFLHDHGQVMPPDDVVRLVYGRAWHEIHAEICRRFPAVAAPIDVMSDRMRPYFERRLASRDTAIPGSVRALRRLAAELPVCIVSGSSRRQVGEAIARLGVGGLVRFHLGSEDYAPGKPDPACFLLAARRLGVDPVRCLVFEDSWAGVQAARAAGMWCVALVRPGRPAQDVAAASLVLDDLDRFTWASLARRAR